MLYMKFGYEGLGLFYTILEKMAKQEKPVKTTVLKTQLRIGKRLEKCWTFMEEIDIIQSKNGETFNKELLNFSEKYQIKKEKTRKRVSEWRDRQEDENDVTCYEDVSNALKVKESKVNKEKKELNISFDEFWNSYGKKVGAKNKCEKKWLALTDDERQEVIDTLPSFLSGISEKKFVPFPETYLNQRRWEDEIKEVLPTKPVTTRDIAMREHERQVREWEQKQKNNG